MVLLATVVAPNGAPCSVRIAAKSTREPVMKYPAKKSAKQK